MVLKTISAVFNSWCVLFFALAVAIDVNAASVDSICYNFPVTPTPPPSEQPKCRVIGNTMYWEGEISGYLLHEIKTEYSHITRLELNSRGGYFEDAVEIAHYLHEKNIHTNVREGAFCASACTLVYQAGTRRTAHLNARFLYHSANYSGEDWYGKWEKHCTKNGRSACRVYLVELIEKSQQSTEALFKLYRHYGVNETFFADYRQLPESENWFENGNFSRLRDWLPTVDQLMKYNIVQGKE